MQQSRKHGDEYTPIATAILGATGYVAGETIRLIAGHPRLRLVAAISSSQAGARIAEVFPHLAGARREVSGLALAAPAALDELIDAGAGKLAIFSCLPHGAAAAEIDRILERAARRGVALALVDLSADFRLGGAAAYQEVYGAAHPAPARFADFTCALPDLERGTPRGAIAHPGCFTTAVTLALAPLVALDLVRPSFHVSAVTGSTGSGREPTVGTHHPERHSNLRAYNPLRHRHAPEMEMLLARAAAPAGDESRARPRVLFAPHSGPFARGIHATLFAELHAPMSAADLAERMSAYYAHTPFVEISVSPPTLKEVVGTNRCRIGVATRGVEVALFSVIDNLTKGAAGGAVQWMNRLLGFDESTGLELAGLGWS